MSKKWLVTTGCLLCLSGLLLPGSGLTHARFYDTESTGGNIFTAWKSDNWTQTTVADFTSGISENVTVVTASPPPANNGDVQLSTGGGTGTVTDNFTDTTKIQSYTNLQVVTSGSGYVMLAISNISDNQTLRPNGDNTTQLSRFPGTSTNNFSLVADIVPDEDSTYVFAPFQPGGGGTRTDLYNMTDPTFYSTVDNVTIYIRCRTTKANQGSRAQSVIRTYGVDYTSADFTLNTSYSTYSQSYTNNPNTGQPWTLDELRFLLGGVQLEGLGNANSLCTQLYIVVYYKPYYRQGTMTSTNLLSGITSTSINSFTYSAENITASENITVQFSKDGTNWYNSAGTLNGSNTLSNGTNTISLAALGWSGSVFYYRANFASTGLKTPRLNDISLAYTGSSQTSGRISSQVFNTGIAGATWDALFWSENVTGGTDINFWVRASDTAFSADNATLPWIFKGGTSPYLSGLPSGQYKQWRAVLTSPTPGITPILHEVRVWYDP